MCIVVKARTRQQYFNSTVCCIACNGRRDINFQGFRCRTGKTKNDKYTSLMRTWNVPHSL